MIMPFYKDVVRLLPLTPEYTLLRAEDVIAVCLQESGGVATFSPTEKLYQDNLEAAHRGTTLPHLLLMDALMIKGGMMDRRIAKFRFEPSYWAWSGTLKLSSPTHRFLVSCSFGLGQQMMKYVIPKDVDSIPKFIEDFKADIDTQIRCCIGNLKNLMIQNNGDLFHAYKQYNSGNKNSTDPHVVSRALHVVELRDIVAKQLKG